MFLSNCLLLSFRIHIFVLKSFLVWQKKFPTGFHYKCTQLSVHFQLTCETLPHKTSGNNRLHVAFCHTKKELYLTTNIGRDSRSRLILCSLWYRYNDKTNFKESLESYYIIYHIISIVQGNSSPSVLFLYDIMLIWGQCPLQQ